MEEKTIGIYYIKNKVTNTIYIGSSINIENRLRNHFNKLINNKHINTDLQKEFHMYGYLNYEVGVIEECKPECTEVELKDIESKYLNKFKKEMKVYNKSEPTTESTLRQSVTPTKPKPNNRTKITQLYIDWYLYSNFHNKMEVVSEMLKDKHIYISKEKLNDFFTQKIENEDVKSDPKLDTRFEKFYSKFNLYRLTALKYRREFMNVYSINVSKELIVYVHKDVYEKLRNDQIKNLAMLKGRDTSKLEYEKVRNLTNEFKDATEEELNDFELFKSVYGKKEAKKETVRKDKSNTKINIKNIESEYIYYEMDFIKDIIDGALKTSNSVVYLDDINDKIYNALKQRVLSNLDKKFKEVLEKYINKKYGFSIVNTKNTVYKDTTLDYFNMERRGKAILIKFTSKEFHRMNNQFN